MYFLNNQYDSIHEIKIEFIFVINLFPNLESQFITCKATRSSRFNFANASHTDRLHEMARPSIISGNLQNFDIVFHNKLSAAFFSFPHF